VPSRRCSGDAEVAVATLERAWSVLRLRGPFRVGVELATAVCGMVGLEAGPAARAGRVPGRALEFCGRVAEARETLEAALESARQAGDRRCEGQVLCDAGFLLAEEGRSSRPPSISRRRSRSQRAWAIRCSSAMRCARR
jgi:hypothetical protein